MIFKNFWYCFQLWVWGIKIKKYDCPCGNKIEVAFYGNFSSGGGSCEKCGGCLYIN